MQGNEYDGCAVHSVGVFVTSFSYIGDPEAHDAIWDAALEELE